MKKVLIPSLVLLGIIILIFIDTGFSVLTPLVGPYGPDPLEPSIKHAEFPFELVYKINGKRKTIKDILICEYDGIGGEVDTYKCREWESSFASGNERIVLWKDSDVKSLNELTAEMIVPYQEIYYDIGTAWYYMGDLEEGEEKQLQSGLAYFQHALELGDIVEDIGYLEDKMVFEKFGIKIISWKCAPPIKNTFK